jgi:hypothetical protein
MRKYIFIRMQVQRRVSINLKYSLESFGMEHADCRYDKS